MSRADGVLGSTPVRDSASFLRRAPSMGGGSLWWSVAEVK